MLYPSEDFLYAPVEWQDCSNGFDDILYHKSADGIAKITINRPQVRNAFRPQTVKEMITAFADARFDEKIGVIVLTGQGEKAFCPAAIKKCAAITAAIKMKRAFITSMYWISNGIFAVVRNRWWQWLPVMRSAAVMCCICYVI